MGNAQPAPAGEHRGRFIPTYMGNAGASRPGRSSPSVHPHVHGERVGMPGMSINRYGSSPRTWGTLSPLFSPHRPLRFIPTYMGNAHDKRAIRPGRQVHPHVHGERISSTALEIRSTGSSPRTWGTLGRRPGTPLDGRFIPTYMGNASGINCSTYRTSVHPHVHGERGGIGIGAKSRFGSSPRTWGTPPCGVFPVRG